MADEVCKICGKTAADHGDTIHQFSLDGNLELKTIVQPRKVGIDVALRLVLIDMGLITADDLARKEAELVDKLRRAAVDLPDGSGSE